MSAGARLVFALGTWHGEPRASIRKWVATQRYTGPTKSGFSLTGNHLEQLHATLRQLTGALPENDTIVATVGRSRTSGMRISIVAPDEESRLPSVDVREFVDTPEYQGPTKQGIRFPWDKLAQVVEFMEVQLTAIGKAAHGEPGFFRELQGVLITDAQHAPDAPPPPAAIEVLLPTDLKSFPDAFLPPKAADFSTHQLPEESLELRQTRDGGLSVGSDGGFEHAVRNESEAKFFLYAHQSGVRKLKLPTEMIHIFGTVSRYETYARDLKRELEIKLIRQCGNRPLAEYQTRQLLTARGIPLL